MLYHDWPWPCSSWPWPRGLRDSTCPWHWFKTKITVLGKLVEFIFQRVTTTHVIVTAGFVRRILPCHTRISDRRVVLSRDDYILPRSRLRCVNSSFSISAPTAWNNLPAHIRSCTSLSQFLSKLKSHVFITSFPPQ